MRDNTQTDRSRELILAASRALTDLVKDASGKEFYGSIRVEIAFENGRAVTVRKNREQTMK